jgi:hypothetical protein
MPQAATNMPSERKHKLDEKTNGDKPAAIIPT